MADVATPTADASAPQGKQQYVKPEKPDEVKYKEDLAKLEKEHAAAQEKLVSRIPRDPRSCAHCAQLHGEASRVSASLRTCTD
jgi:hypothetical protein